MVHLNNGEDFYLLDAQLIFKRIQGEAVTDADLLPAGVAAAKAGDFKQARALLAKVVQANPASEAGWFWLGLVCQSPGQRTYCFQRVLTLNPLNAKARELLNQPAVAPPPQPDSNAVLSTPLAPEHEAIFRPSEAVTSVPEPASRLASDAPTPFIPPNVATQQSLPPEPVPILSSASLPLASDQLSLHGSSPGSKPWTNTEKFLLAFLGFLLAILLCGGSLTYLVNSHQVDRLAGRVAAVIWSPTPIAPISTPTVSVVPSITPSPTITHTFAPTITPTRTPSPTPSPTLSYNSRLTRAEATVEQAKALMNQGEYAAAVFEWNDVIDLVPENAEAYFQRASCYLELIHNQRSREEYLVYLQRALVDLDHAIALGPATGNYFIARYQVYSRLAGEESFRIDYVSLEEIALENLRVANKLGNTQPLSDRDVPFVLYNLGRCEEGMDETRQLIAARGSAASPSAGLNTALAAGYLCLGQLDQALDYINLAIQLTPSSDRAMMKSIILYNLGRLDEALELINESITNDPYYGGARYFLRAAIYAEQGKLDEAEADIDFGYGETWGYFGIVDYAEGRLALARGDSLTALERFQYAEATMPFVYGPLIQRIQREITALGGQLMAVTPQIFISTPIATPQVTITPYATLSFVQPISLTPTPPLAPSLQSTPFALAEGTGTLTLQSQEYPLYHFRPAAPLEFAQVQALTFRLLPATGGGSAPTLQLYLWTSSGGWGMVQLQWGDNPIPYPDRYVMPEGDIYVGLRNYGSDAVDIQNAGFILVVRLDDGTQITYGLQP